MELKISSQSRADYALVSVRGEIDLHTAPQLRRELGGALDGGARRLVVDMSEVDFCDSTGIGVLLSAMKRARERDGALELVAPRPAVLKILQVTGLDAVFTIEPALPLAAGANATE